MRRSELLHHARHTRGGDGIRPTGKEEVDVPRLMPLEPAEETHRSRASP